MLKYNIQFLETEIHILKICFSEFVSKIIRHYKEMKNLVNFCN